MKTGNRSLLEIHLAVFLFGVSGLFGKLLALPSMIIVLGRVFFSSVFLFFVLVILKKNLKLRERKHYMYLLLLGGVLALHWTAFFEAIKLSTVAIGLLTFSTFPVFVTFLEPLFFKEKIRSSDVIVAIVAFTGVVLVIPKFTIGSTVTQGAIWGIVSGLTYAILSILNRKYVKDYSSMVIAFYEQVIATVLLVPFLFIERPIFQARDIILLIVLGTVFTGISHTLFINGLKNVKTQAAGIISTLEPVYGILLATVLLAEIPSMRELLGGVVILSTVFYSTIKSK
tara:strand:+ start:771 stop:1622 length:852 start_codon:yes stop_codon:yes gene_type:complete